MADPTINIPRDSTMNTLAKDTTLAATNTALGSLAKDATIIATNTALGLLGKDASLQDIKIALLSIVSALSPVASGVSFTNTGTGLVSTDVQGALEELDGRQIAADTSTVEDKNGVAVVDRLVYGQKVTAGSVNPSSPLLHQSDVIDDLVTQDATKPLSARQGALLNQNLTELDSYVKGNTLNTLVKITSYTSSNPYTCPKDGFIMVVSASTLGSLTSVFNPINQYVPFARTETVRAGYPQTISIFVKKGMQFYVSKSTGTDGEVYFCGID